MTNTHLFASATGIDAGAAGAPARLRRGEGVARFTIRQRVRERDQSCGRLRCVVSGVDGVKLHAIAAALARRRERRRMPASRFSSGTSHLERSSSHFPFGNTKQPT